MSVDYHIYVGPAIRVVPAWELVQLRGCVKEDCSLRHRHAPRWYGEFCGSCGGAYGTFTSPAYRTEVVDYDNLFGGSERLRSTLTPERAFRVFMPNTTRTPREFDMDPHGDEVDQVLDEGAIARELDWMRNTYAQEIAELERVYPGCVAVQWVFFSWTS